MNTLQKIGSVTKNMRNARGLSQEQFCNLCGIDQHYISNIENGQRNLSIDIIERISKFFGLTLAQFFAAVEAVKDNDIPEYLQETISYTDREDSNPAKYTHRNNTITDPHTSFVNYMKKQGWSKSTISKYASVVPNCMDVQKVIMEVTKTTYNMYDVTDIKVLMDIVSRITGADFDNVGHHMYSAGLKKYVKFLETIF